MVESKDVKENGNEWLVLTLARKRSLESAESNINKVNGTKEDLGWKWKTKTPDSYCVYS